MDREGIDHLIQIRIPLKEQMRYPDDLHVKVVTFVNQEDREGDLHMEDHDTGRFWLRADLSTKIMELCIGWLDVDFGLEELVRIDAEDGILSYYKAMEPF